MNLREVVTGASSFILVCLISTHKAEEDHCKRKRLFQCTSTNQRCSTWGFFDLPESTFFFCKGKDYRACLCLCGNYGPTMQDLFGVCVAKVNGTRAATMNTSSDEQSEEDSAAQYRTNETFTYRTDLQNVSENSALNRFVVMMKEVRKEFHSSEGRMLRRGKSGRLINFWPYSRVPGNGYIMMGSGDVDSMITDDFPVPGSIIAAVTFMILLILMIPALWFYRKPPPGAILTSQMTTSL